MKRQRASLGELCRLVKGTSPISRTPPGSYPLVTTGREHKTSDSFQLDAEAVCIPLISSTGHGHASLKRVHYQSGKFALANLLAAALVKDDSVLSPKFLTRYLNFTKDRLIVPLMTGAANMSISLDRLATVPIEFPPLTEQERNVKLLDEADDLRNLRTQTDHRTASLILAIFHEMFGDPASNEKKWPTVQLNEVVTRITNGFVGPTRDIYQESGIPYILSRHIQDNQVRFDGRTFISPEFNQRNAKSILCAGDVLLVQTGHVGEAAVVPKEHRGHNCHAVIVLTPVAEKLCGDYLCFWLTSKGGRRLTTGIQTGAILKHLNCGDVKKLLIMLPPLALQKEFAARVTEIRAVQAEQAASRQRLENLFQSMLHRAFNGEL